MKKKILLVAERRDEFLDWVAEIFKKEYDIKIFSQHEYFGPAPGIISRLWNLHNSFLKLVVKEKPEKIFVYGKAFTTIWLFIFFIRLRGLKTEIIVYRYDIENFRSYSGSFTEKIGHFITRFLEKYCMINAHKIVHKGLSNELEFLSFYPKLRKKKHYLFREFIDRKMIVPFDLKKKLSFKDRETHLVLIGQLPLLKVDYADTIWEFYPRITTQKIHLHVYMKIPNETIERFKEIEKENRYFHFHGYLERKKLIAETSKYDYGLFVTSRNSGKKINYFVMTAMGFRIFDYILAHVPVIACNEAQAVSEFVNTNKVGFSMPNADTPRIGTILKKNSGKYKETISNIDKTLKRFSDFDDFLDFIRN